MQGIPMFNLKRVSGVVTEREFRLTAAAASVSGPIGHPGSSDGSCIWIPYDVKYVKKA